MNTRASFLAEKVWLAPMSGATDAPFRRQAVRFGAPAVVSEMVAGEALHQARPDVVRRMCRHEGQGKWIVQLAARRPEDMLKGSVLLREAGVDVIDINMGCPARKVTGGQSGSALMRDLELAQRIIEAALEGAGDIPVTVKMRLGWDDRLRNAPDLAQLAEGLGVVMLTVHGRTRCEFYRGKADWGAIRRTVRATTLPVIANGDIDDVETARQALKLSGAYGVMIGRLAMGQPWRVGQIASELAGRAYAVPTLQEQADSLIEQIQDSVQLYGERLGVRTVRKHIAAAIDLLDIDLAPQVRRQLRSRLCQIGDAFELITQLLSVYADASSVRAA